MFDDPSSSNPLVGTWEGYYDHHNKVYSSKNYPITATIVQEGRSFRGIMIDGVTDIRHLYRKIIEANEGRMTPFVAERARQFLEDFPDGIIESNLPEESRLEGKVSGSVVRFTKTYLGEYSTYGIFGGHRTLIRRVGKHRVHYEGTLTSDSGRIEGVWVIRHPGLLGRFLRPRGTGRFELFKKG